MNLAEIIEKLNLVVLTEPADFSEVVPTCGYSSDLLSCVMAGAKARSLWITLQAHMNVVAIAALLEISAVIITEGAQPEAATLAKAKDQGIIILSTPLPTFAVIGKLWELGIRDA